MTTAKQDSEFAYAVVGELLLEKAIDWISSNMSPEDVFSERDLETWSRSHDYILPGDQGG